jgi:hypothetical protein
VPRVLLRLSLALVVAAAGFLICWRVLAPAEVLASATTPYPSAAERAPGVTGRTNVAPLIVDGGIRVFAAKRQIRADAPVDAKSTNTARWSFRRWPQQLSGVVAIGHTVVSRWSDGQVVALDARSGTLAWRVDGPPATGYGGHRTGAATVWAPPGLHVTEDAVVVSRGEVLAAYDVGTGIQRWRTSVPAACSDGFTTAGGAYVCPTGAYDTATGAALAGWPSGPYTPIACEVAASRCPGLRDAAGRGWFTDTATPRRGLVLDHPDSTIEAGLVCYPADGALQVATTTGTIVRGFPAAAVLGASPGQQLVLLTPERHLLLADPHDGRIVADFPLAVDQERLAWSPGRWQVANGYLAIERLTPDGPADPDAPDHYFTVETVILAAL